MDNNYRLKKSSQDTHLSEENISELEVHLGYWLRFVSNHVSYTFQRRVEALDVTVSEWVLLAEIYRLGQTSPRNLVQTMGMTQGAISKLLNRLQKKLFIHVTVNEKDRRHQIITLTSKGKNLVPLLAKCADDNDKKFFGHLSKDAQEELKGIMKEIVYRHQLKAIPTN